MNKVILFDFDYTLADSSDGIVYCFEKVAELNGLKKPLRNQIKNAIGMPLSSMLSLNFDIAESEAEKLIQLSESYKLIADQVAAQMTEFYPDAEWVMKRLQIANCKLGIVSTKNRSRIIETMSTRNVQMALDVIIGGEDVSAHKPSPEGLYKAVDLLNVTMKDIIFVGDSYYDYQAALNASCEFMAVITGKTTRDDFIRFGQNSELIFDNLSQIADYVIDRYNK